MSNSRMVEERLNALAEDATRGGMSYLLGSKLGSVVVPSELVREAVESLKPKIIEAQLGMDPCDQLLLLLLLNYAGD